MQEWDKIELMNPYIRQAQYRKGFSQVILFGIIAVLILVGAGGFLVLRENKMPSSKTTIQQEVSPQKTEVEAQLPETHTIEDVTKPTLSPEQSIQPPKLITHTELKQKSVPSPATQPLPSMATPKMTITSDNHQSSQATDLWNSRDYVWYPNGTPPACPEPFILQTPVDMGLVTGALWPGQVRGEYKAHGGFRFNNDGTNNINVRAPVGGHLIQASQYLESGEKQYLLIFSVPCGFVYRFDHPRVLSSKLTEAVKNLPPATEGDSRTTYINPPVWVDAGEVVATSIGITKNIFVDFGLYDVRKPNNITPNPEWAELYNTDKEFGHYGVCFFDYLPNNDGAIMRSLPTGKEGKVSDYCK